MERQLLREAENPPEMDPDELEELAEDEFDRLADELYDRKMDN